jgi:hypothetical protein
MAKLISCENHKVYINDHKVYINEKRKIEYELHKIEKELGLRNDTKTSNENMHYHKIEN